MGPAVGIAFLGSVFGDRALDGSGSEAYQPLRHHPCQVRGPDASDEINHCPDAGPAGLNGLVADGPQHDAKRAVRIKVGSMQGGIGHRGL